jgi:hypothetical protein
MPLRHRRYRAAVEDESQAAPALQLEGVDLTWIEIDFQVRLKFVDTVVTIGTAFRLTADGTAHVLDPELRSELGPLLAVYPATVATARITDDLTLLIEFMNGATIEVPQDPHYESWLINGPDSRLIVCPPSGGSGLVIWS